MISSLELANICGVSQGTVDRAIHNRKGINEQTRKKILEAARKYGYTPHPAAREILTGKSIYIGAIIPKLNSVFLMDLMTVAKKYLNAENYKFVISPIEDGEEFLDMLSDFSARRFPAAIVVPPKDSLIIPENLTREMKVISLLSPCNGKNTFFITPDEEKTGRDAVKHFISNGKRRIVHATYPNPNLHAVKQRAYGYEREMKENGLTPTTTQIGDEAGILKIIKKTQADALFCHNDWLALSMLRILEKNNYRIPHDISILGVDNSPTFNELCPDISTMAYPFEWVGKRICEIVKTGKIRSLKSPQFKIMVRKT